MGTEMRTQIIAGLRDFVTTNGDDQLRAHYSLYSEILQQWQALNRFSLPWANELSQRMVTAYWQGMAKWYDRFSQEKDKIRHAEMMPSQPMQDFYVTLVAGLADEVVAKLPEPMKDKDGVVHLNDFPLLLNYELCRFRELEIYRLTPVDCLMLVEYWKAIDKMVKICDGDEVK